MKENKYIYCNTNAEFAIKSVTKSRKIGVLYGIIDGNVFVYQKFKIIPITLDMFAEGMGIDLLNAQAIISQTPPEEMTIVGETLTEVVNDTFDKLEAEAIPATNELATGETWGYAEYIKDLQERVLKLEKLLYVVEENESEIENDSTDDEEGIY